MSTEPDIEAIPEEDKDESMLVWTSFMNNPITEFKNKRRKPYNGHPLLKQLIEAENDLKHSEYTAHLLIQKQAREYAFAVENVLSALKNGTDYLIKSADSWRGDNYKIDVPFSVATTANKSAFESELTQIGRKILRISEAVKSLQQEDALTFWASQQRVTILQELVSFSKNILKLRRKLVRIKGSLEDRVRNVRRIAIKCECEITGNLVPSEIYYQWVKEDSILYKDDLCDTANVSLQTVSKVKEKMSSLKKAALNLLPCIQPDDLHSASETESDTEGSSFSRSTITRSAPVKVYQMDKHIEILHKMYGNVMEEDSVCDDSLKNLVSKLSTVANVNEKNAACVFPLASQLEDVWAPKPSQKYLEAIASNVAPPQKFNTHDYVYDHCESRIKEVSANSYAENLLEDELNNQNNVISCPSNFNTIVEDRPSRIDGILQPLSSKSKSNNSSCSMSSPPAQKLLNDSMGQQVSLIMNAKSGMDDIISRITNAIRGMEREWLSPEAMKHSKASGKEFFQLVDFIVETAKLTEAPAFASRLYPEDRDEIVSVLDPVLRELTNCFMALHSLHNLVAVDVQYLKELVAGFPKGSLVIRDWVSDPSIDQELGEMEQPTAYSDFDVDVDELFE